MRRHLVFGSIVMLAWATTVLAAEDDKRPTRAAGTVVSATLDGGLIKWEVDLGQEAGGKKALEMTADVRALYTEKDGVKQALRIFRAGGREFTPKEGQTLVTGKVTAAKVDGDTVLITVTPSAGEKPAALELKLPTKVSVGYREGEGGKLALWSIGVPRPPKAENK